MDEKFEKSNLIKIISTSVLILAAFLFVAMMGYKALVLRTTLGEAIYPEEIVESINVERSKANLPALVQSPTLDEAAEAKAKDMAARGYFSHDTPDGRTPWEFMDESGYYFLYAGENLAVDFFDVDEVTEAWMESDGHRENILNIDFTETGVGVAPGMYEGREVMFYVQMFGRRTPVPYVASDDLPRVLGANTEDSTEEMAAVSQAVGSDSVFEGLLSNPSAALKYSYYLLTAIILGALLSSVILSGKTRSPFLPTVFYGLGATFIIWTLFYVYSAVTIVM